MLQRASFSLLLLAGCGAPEDDWVVRPPGGGTGGTGVTIDATPSLDAASDDGGVGLTGLVCVVTDLRIPEECPIGPAATGVLVRRAGDTTGATSTADARFTLAVTDPVVILDVASDSTTLQPSIVPVDNDGRLVHAPVPTSAAWSATVASLSVTIAPGNGSIAIYTDTAVGAHAAGVTFALPVGAISGPFYDGADATSWTTGGGTGLLGATLLVDLPPGTYAVDGNQGARLVSITGIPVGGDAVTFVRAVLPP